ncbi:methyl-CpG-binding domain protein 3-like [Lytechinus variegatus]|uniref:methyl-CpG-binding domain protein 3-like n=1 Tax=Lytechinus variegatus TaxID=7654 RepID=UPI001BB24F31|nr:methyl-CpG-binding domain protein 3-like [Lytechinus variegatus]
MVFNCPIPHSHPAGLNMCIELSLGMASVHFSEPHLDKNPGVYLNADQPPCLKFMVTEADIRRQEERVKEVRDRLQRVMKGDPEAIQDELDFAEDD